MQRSFGFAGVSDLPAGVVYEISGPFRQAAAADRARPRMRPRVRKRTGMDRFLERGLPVKLELDEFAGVKAVLSLPRPGGRKRTIAKASPSVAVRDLVTLRLKPNAKGRRLLQRRARNDDEIVTNLEVVATDAAGNRTVARRRVILIGAEGGK